MSAAHNIIFRLLAPFDNIRIEAGGELFAKVLRRTDVGFHLRFTPVPEGYCAWVSAQMKR